MRQQTVRRPSDDELAALVGDTLHRVDDAELAQPATAPDWARLNVSMRGGRLRGPRRIQRLVVLMVFVAVALVGTGVAVGLRSGLFPDGLPASKSHSQQGFSALYDQPAKGSLKGDQAWLRALKDRLGDPSNYASTLMAGHRADDPDGIRILYAADVGGFRLALAEGVWTDTKVDPDAEPMQWWLSGPAGAAAADLALVGRLDPPQDTTIILPGVDDAPPEHLLEDRPSAMVVVSAEPVPVRLVTGRPVIDADARVTVPGRMLTPVDGVYAAVVPAAESHTTSIYVAGQRSGVVLDQDVDDPIWTTGKRTPLRGGPIEPMTPAIRYAPGTEDGPVVDFASSLADVVQSRRSDGAFQMLASAPPVDGSGETGRSLVGMFTLPSGARVLGAFAVATEGEDGEQNGMQWLLTARLVPADVPVDHLSAVWVQHDGLEGSVIDPAVPGWAGAMGPAGTASVEWLHADGSTTTSPALDTMATTRDTSITGARFLDAQGRSLLMQMAGDPVPANGSALPPVQEALRPDEHQDTTVQPDES